MTNYFDAVHAFRQLTRSDDKGQKLGKISKSLNAIREGFDYFSVEITGITGTQYLIEAYGNDAIELFSEMANRNSEWDKKE